MAKIILLCLLSVLICATGQRITTIHLDGVQYFISRMNPYSPELNYFLAYQYCRSLGLQLASFETKEKAESMTTYLKNAGYGNYDFWTSGNRLGTGMFLWMSTGLPFNATFDFFENSGDAIQASMLDANDHNSNTAPQRTARDSSSGSEKGCVILKQPSLKWMPEDCSAVKDFICEQTRCYYYNYGSIPVSSAQGRPITSTIPPTTQQHTVTNSYYLSTTTPLPMIMSTYASLSKKSSTTMDEDESQPSFMSLQLHHEQDTVEGANSLEQEQDITEQARDMKKQQQHQQPQPLNSNELTTSSEQISIETKSNEELEVNSEEQNVDEEQQHVDAIDTDDSASSSSSSVGGGDNLQSSIQPEVDEHVKQISHKIEKIVSSEQMYPIQHHPHAHFQHQDNSDDDISRQSFLSLTDLIRTLRPNDKQIIPQIDSDYSNAMRVLGENTGPLQHEESRSTSTLPLTQAQQQHALKYSK